MMLIGCGIGVAVGIGVTVARGARVGVCIAVADVAVGEMDVFAGVADCAAQADSRKRVIVTRTNKVFFISEFLTH